MDHRRTAAVGVLMGLLWLAPGGRGEAAEPVNNCWAEMETTAALSECLAVVKEDADARMVAVYEAAMTRQRQADAALGRDQATRALTRAQRAFELYRDLHCQVRELQPGRSGGRDAYQGCWINQTRDRIAALELLAAEEQAMDTQGLTGVTWIARSIAGESVAEGVKSTLILDKDGKIAGSGGCNRYFGGAETSGDALEIGPLGSTRMACPEPKMGQETRFMRALQSAKTFRIDNGTLVLSDAEGTDILTFRAAE